MRTELDAAALAAEEVVDGLKHCYKKVILPLEKDFKYDLFFNSPLLDVDFEAKPMVLILGQYSTGKTSFIKHLIGRDFPGMRIGPEPTTDKFNCVYYGEEDQNVPGTVLQTNPDLPFRPVGQFGNNFLAKFEGSACRSNALKSFTFIDSPGVLSGKKQRNRQYPFKDVVSWFSDRASRILLFFDCNKLDISDEFKEVISGLRKHDEKIRIVLNKADTISEKELIRVYGALMWSLGKVFKTPEVPKVYISSFSDAPLDQKNYCFKLFENDRAELVGELKSLPRQAAMQKVNETLKRMRLVKMHAQILSELKSELPKWFGKSKKMRQIVENLPSQFKRIARKIGVPPSDFPNLERFKKILTQEDLSKYPKLSTRKFRAMNYAMEKTIPTLVKRLNDKTVGGSEIDNFNPFEDDYDEISSLEEDYDPTQDLDDKIRDIDMRGSYYTESIFERPTVKKKKSHGVLSGSLKSVKTNMRFSSKKKQKVGGSVAASSTRSRASKGRKINTARPSLGRSYKSVTARRSQISQAQKHQSTGDSNLLVVEDGSGYENARLRQLGGISTNSPNNMRNSRSRSARDDREDARSFYDYKTKQPRQLPAKAPGGASADWVVSMVDKTESDNIFYQQRLVNSKLTGNAARKAFAHLGLSTSVLHRIWVLVDFEGTNKLDADQFALAIWLAKQVRDGYEIPEELTWQMVPPSYRDV